MKVSPWQVALLGLVLAAGLIRLQGLGRSLDHDEVVTVREYAAKPWHDVVTSYTAPNNHILHTLCVKLARTAFGARDWVVRLPAWLGGCLGIVVAYSLARRFAGSRPEALLAAALLALSPVAIGYARQARGYTMLMCCAAAFGFCLCRALEDGRQRWLWWAAAVVTGFLTVYTIPSGLFLVISLLLASALALALELAACADADERRARRALLTALAGAGAILGVLVALAYGPLLGDMVASSRRWGVDVRANPSALWDTVQDVARLAAPRGSTLIGTALGIIGLATLWRGNRRVALLCVSVMTVPFLFNLVTGVAGPARVYLFVLPFAFIAISRGAMVLATRLAATLAPRSAVASRAVVAGIGLLTAGAYADPASWPGPRDNQYRQAGAYLQTQTQADEIIVSPYIMDVCLSHYSDNTPERRMWRVWRGNPWRELLFVASEADPRFGLDDYTLTTNYVDAGGYLRALDLPRAAFSPVAELGPIGVYRLREATYRIHDIEALADGQQWALADQSSAGAVNLSFDEGRGISGSGALHIEAARGVDFALRSNGSFQVPLDGLFVLSYAQSAGPGTYATLCEGGGGRAECEPVQMVKPLNLVGGAGGGEGQWHGAFSLSPIAADTEYRIYLYGNGIEDLHYCDFRGVYIPFEAP